MNYWINSSPAVYNNYKSLLKKGKKGKTNSSVQNTSDFLIPEEPGGCFEDGWV
jgi:hypothetical protein